MYSGLIAIYNGVKPPRGNSFEREDGKNIKDIGEGDRNTSIERRNKTSGGC